MWSPFCDIYSPNVEKPKKLTKEEICLIIQAIDEYDKNTNKMVKRHKISKKDGEKFLNISNNIRKKMWNYYNLYD